MRALFNIAGGIRYHARGLRNAERTWAPFRESLGEWLQAWQPGGPKLIIIGPSAGYCLHPEWLGRFNEIVCLDPDPMARWLFRRRLRATAPNTRLSWYADDFLAERTPLLQVRKLESFLNGHPRAPVLFSNFLGQLSLLLYEKRTNVPKAMSVWKSSLVRHTLANRSWASFHDRLSGTLAPRFVQPYVSPARMNDDEILEKLYPEPMGKIELGDHDTAGLFPADREHTYFYWNLTPRWTHLIEATRF